MSAGLSIRPGPDEHDAYYARYVELVPDRPIVDTLERQFSETDTLLAEATPGDETFRYEPSKWSLRESVGHVVDTERMFTFRALSIARGDPAPLPGMDQNLWAGQSNADARTMDALRDEWRAVRHATVLFFCSLDEAAWERRGVASERPVSVRALAWIVAGHELWHRELYRDRYVGRA